LEQLQASAELRLRKAPSCNPLLAPFEQFRDEKLEVQNRYKSAPVECAVTVEHEDDKWDLETSAGTANLLDGRMTVLNSGFGHNIMRRILSQIVNPAHPDWSVAVRVRVFGHVEQRRGGEEDQGGNRWQERVGGLQPERCGQRKVQFEHTDRKAPPGLPTGREERHLAKDASATQDEENASSALANDVDTCFEQELQGTGRLLQPMKAVSEGGTWSMQTQTYNYREAASTSTPTRPYQRAH
jgi:hypothetical protein